jgi:cytochrome d ubiquinol oxidase subunit II
MAPDEEVLLALLLAGASVASLTFYVLMGGADYGVGVWHLLARGPRADAHRALIARAIAPIWEANHVWLILVVTVLFTAFPPAFALIMTTLHIPLALLLVGIVFRGSAFAFRGYAIAPPSLHPHWERLFAVSSLLTPILLGITIGAIASGTLQITPGDAVRTFIRPWLAVFPFAVGFFALALFVYLGAVYLILETEDPAIRDDFRRRAMGAGLIANALAMLVLVLSQDGAPQVWEGLTSSFWSWLLLASTIMAAIAALLLLWLRRYYVARGMAVAHVTLILWGWALGQYPYLIEPSLTIYEAAAPTATLRLVLLALVVGALILFPSLYYLYRVFKGRAVFGEE